MLLFSHSVLSDSATPWTAACQAFLSLTISQSLLKLMSIELVMPSNHLIPCHPLSACLQSFPASGSFPMTCLLASGGQYIGASASESICPMNIHKWSFRIDWLDLLAVQGISRVFFNTTVWKHQFFSAQLSLRSNSHSHTWLLEENIALTIWTFVSKVMSLLLNMLSRFIIIFLPRSKYLLISWLQSPSAVILEPSKK